MSNNGKPPLFVKCVYPQCADTTLMRARGYCREHFVLTHLNPLKKEEKNLNEALNVVQNSLRTLMAELSQAEYEHEGMRYICHKCGGFSTKGLKALETHQTFCNGKGKKPTTPSKPRAAKPVESTDYDEEMTDDE